MDEPNDREEARIAAMLERIRSQYDDYPNYRRGVVWGLIAAAVGFLVPFLPLLALAPKRSWMALVSAGVLAVVFWVFGTFRPSKS